MYLICSHCRCYGWFKSRCNFLASSAPHPQERAPGSCVGANPGVLIGHALPPPPIIDRWDAQTVSRKEPGTADAASRSFEFSYVHRSGTDGFGGSPRARGQPTPALAKKNRMRAHACRSGVAETVPFKQVKPERQLFISCITSSMDDAIPGATEAVFLCSMSESCRCESGRVTLTKASVYLPRSRGKGRPTTIPLRY